MWINLAKLYNLVRQRGVDPRGITVFVDDHVIDPRYRRPLPEGSALEEDNYLSEEDPEED